MGLVSSYDVREPRKSIFCDLAPCSMFNVLLMIKGDDSLDHQFKKGKKGHNNCRDEGHDGILFNVLLMIEDDDGLNHDDQFKGCNYRLNDAKCVPNNGNDLIAVINVKNGQYSATMATTATTMVRMMVRMTVRMTATTTAPWSGWQSRWLPGWRPGWQPIIWWRMAGGRMTATTGRTMVKSQDNALQFPSINRPLQLYKITYY